MLLCQVLKSSRKTETYLYMEQGEGLERVPDSLLQQLGELKSVMLLKLEPGRKLARADVESVRRAIEEQGYYLQMPPTPAELLRREKSGD